MPRIGIMGGTFDPIHLGHLAAAEGALHLGGLDQVVFLPNGQPLHKEGVVVTPAAHRANMVRLAIASNPRFSFSDLELRRGGASYTLFTVREFQRENPGAEVRFIIGMDSLEAIETWHEYRTLLREVDLLVVNRPGYGERAGAVRQRLGPELTRRIRVVELPGIDLSASDLRSRAARGASLRYLVPEPALEYMRQNGLYGVALRAVGSADRPWAPLAELESALTARLSPERLAHTRRVRESAIALAAGARLPPQAVEVAALMHDFAREMDPGLLLAEAHRLGLIIDPAEEEQPVLLHGPVAAGLLAEMGLVGEPGVLAAIRWHTTGRAGMSALERLIWLADYMEPGRRFAGAEKIRSLARQDSGRALLLALEQTILHAIGQGWPLHTCTVQARNWLRSQLERSAD